MNSDAHKNIVFHSVSPSNIILISYYAVVLRKICWILHAPNNKYIKMLFDFVVLRMKNVNLFKIGDYPGYHQMHMKYEREFVDIFNWVSSDVLRFSAQKYIYKNLTWYVAFNVINLSHEAVMALPKRKIVKVLGIDVLWYSDYVDRILVVINNIFNKGVMFVCQGGSDILLLETPTGPKELKTFSISVDRVLAEVKTNKPMSWLISEFDASSHLFGYLVKNVSLYVENRKPEGIYTIKYDKTPCFYENVAYNCAERFGVKSISMQQRCMWHYWLVEYVYGMYHLFLFWDNKSKGLHGKYNYIDEGRVVDVFSKCYESFVPFDNKELRMLAFPAEVRSSLSNSSFNSEEYNELFIGFLMDLSSQGVKVKVKVKNCSDKVYFNAFEVICGVQGDFLELVKGYDVVVSHAYTTPGLVLSEMGKTSYYYDAELSSMDNEMVVHSASELLSKVSSLT